MSAIPRQSARRLAEGVYLNLPAAEYFEQPAMGSSDYISLIRKLLGWWWSSRHNPDREEPKSPELTYGSALHALLLEGVEAFERAFAVMPSKSDFLDLVTTVDEMKSALEREGFNMAGSSKFKAADWATQMLLYLPDRPCWPNIVAEAKALAGERPTVSSVDDRMLRLMRHVATDPTRSDNAAVRRLFEFDDPDHPPLAEVSIFAEVDGVWRRWRLDKMLPAATLDLKSLGGWKGRPLAYEVGQVAAQRGWDIQRADYDDGRAIAYRLIGEGKLHGGSLEQRRYIERIAQENPTWDWIWLCYQKPSPKGSAPVLMPVWDDRDSFLHNCGRRKLERAKAIYKGAVAEFGLETPWARVEPLHYTDEPREPRVHFPHWIGDVEPIAPEAYATETEESENV
jgi:hypothetical protein